MVLADDVYNVSSAGMRSGNGTAPPGSPLLRGSANYGASVNAGVSAEAGGVGAMWAVGLVALAFILLHLG